MRTRFPPRPIVTDWPRVWCDREEAVRVATAEVFVIGNPIVQAKRVRGLRHLLDWLTDQPGDSWQQRWLNSGAESLGPRWRHEPLAWLRAHGQRSQWLPTELSSAMRVLIFADVLRPTLRWLATTPAIKSELAAGLALERDRAGFSKLLGYCHAEPGISDLTARFTAQRAAVIVAAKGGTLADITVGDVLELIDTETDLLTAWPRAIPDFYQILRDLGFLGDQAPQRFRQLRTGGQLTPEQLVDRYELACGPIRNLLVDYLKERQPSLDYNSLKDLSYYLARRFWTASTGTATGTGIQKKVTPPDRRHGRYTRERDSVTKQALYRAGATTTHIAHKPGGTPEHTPTPIPLSRDPKPIAHQRIAVNR